MNSISVSSKITVFVEDELTREYLSTIWAFSLSKLSIICAGNINTVRNLVAYHRANNDICFGIVDRDYRWADSDNNGHIFTLKRHEIENYCLDVKAMHKSSFNAKQNLSESRIGDIIGLFVNERKFWFACCYLLHKLDLLVKEGFPPHPPQTNIIDSQSIIAYINNCGYHADVTNRLNNINSTGIEAYVSGILADIEKHYTQNQQMVFFPGKEVFRHIRGYLGSNYADGRTMDIDMAKEIGDYQVKTRSIPRELVLIEQEVMRGN